MELKVKVRRQHVVAEDITLPANSVETILCVFDFDAEWKDYTKNIVFCTEGRDGTSITRGKLCTDGSVEIPRENLIPGKIYITPAGITGDGSKVLTTTMQHPLRVVESGATYGVNPDQYTPDEIEQALATAADALEYAKEKSPFVVNVTEAETLSADADYASIVAAIASGRLVSARFGEQMYPVRKLLNAQTEECAAVEFGYVARSGLYERLTIYADGSAVAGNAQLDNTPMFVSAAEGADGTTVSDTPVAAIRQAADNKRLVLYRLKGEMASILMPLTYVSNSDAIFGYVNGDGIYVGVHIDENGKVSLKERSIDSGADDVEISNGKIYLLRNGERISTGVNLPENDALSFDSGYVDESGKLHLTKYGADIEGFTPIPVGTGGGLSFDSGNVDENGYLHLTKDGEDIEGFDPFFVGSGGGGGGGYGSTMRLTNGLPSRTFAVMESAESANIVYTATSIDDEDKSPTGDLSESWQVNGVRVAARTIKQGENTFDVKPYLTAGAENAVKLTVEDAYGNSKTITWTATVISFGLTWNLGEIENHGSDALTVRLVPTGQGNKTLRVTLDGAEIYSTTVSTTGRTVTATIPAQTHGAHAVEAWIETAVDGTTVTTEHLRHVGVWTQDENTAPIVAVLESTITMKQFATYGVKWYAYDPESETAMVELQEDGVNTNVVTVGREVQTWAYRASQDGAKTLTVKCGAVSANIAVTVESVGQNIAPVTSGLVLDLDPTGHSSAESGRTNFGYKDGSGANHPLTFSDNFDWTNGGFQLDDEGVTAFVVKRGCRATLDTSLFANEAKTTGKEIKLVFKSMNVHNYDAELMRCVSGSIGLKLQAQQATLSSSTSTMDVQYCENRKIEMDINIEPSSEKRLAMISLKAAPSRCIQYDAQDSWQQTIPDKLSIGSDDCDVWVYRIKMYANNLTRYEVLDNYIADCADIGEMLARYARNDIYNADGSISPTKLAAANRKLRIIRIWADRMTTSKNDEVTCKVELIFTQGGEEHHFIATNVKMKAQGTSSLEYILAALNLDLDFSNATWVNGNGEPITGYAMTENSIPVSYFNLKANVASSENANNVCLADDYNTFNAHVFPGKQEDQRVRDTIEGHPCAVFFTNTSSTAIEVGARKLAAGETMLYFAGDMNNSKKNFAVFGQDNTKYPLQCCVEVLNNNNEQCRFRSDDLSAEQFDGDGNFEFRFPKNPTEEMKAAFREMQAWVVSTTRDLATGAAITPVAYDGVSYANDTADYRAAKFKAEVGNYFSTKSLEFHLLFTGRKLMPDNRAKNVFFSYEYAPEAGGYRWNVRCNYDNDTGLGNDNSGGLTFTYGMEDTDKIGDSDVFNAADSTLWCNVRDLLADELAEMYRSLKGSGAWSASRFLAKVKEYQAARPEALVIEDMYNKYVEPLLQKNSARYLPMMLGTKEDQREQFETYQEVYFDSKYLDTTDRSNAISMRVTTASAEEGNIDVTPYSDLYINVMYGNAGRARMRAKRGVTYTMQCPAASMNDLETYIFAASHLTKLGSLAKLRSKFIDLSAAARMQTLPIGSGDPGYQNNNLTALTFGANTMLSYIDLRGLTNLMQAVDLSVLVSLEEFYATNSGITGVTFADGCPLRIAKLPEVRSLTAKRLRGIETFEMSGAALERIWVEDCPSIDTQALIEQATDIASGRLTGVDWSLTNADAVMRLIGKSGIAVDGSMVSGFVLTGAAYINVITADELSAINTAFPDLTVTYGSIVEAHTVTFVNDSGTLYTETVRHGEAATDPVKAGYIPTPTKAPTIGNTHSFSGWDKDLTNVTSDLVVTAQFSAQVRRYTVEFWNGVELCQSTTVDAFGSVEYIGADLVPPEGKIWGGWDKLTTNVQCDIRAYSVFYAPKAPAAYPTAYDYLYSDDPADNSAYTFEEFWYMIVTDDANGDPLARTYFQLCDKIKIVPNTTVFADTEIVLQLEAFRHFKQADGNGFARTFWGMIGVMNADRAMNNANTNVGGYAAMTIRDWLNNTVFSALPQKWKGIIEPVQVLSSAGGTSASIVQSIDKLFLRSHAEVGFDTDAVPYVNEVAAGADEVQLKMYNSGNTKIKKRYNGTGAAATWRLRSPDSAFSTDFRGVYSYGNAYSLGATGAYGASFGFCIGSAA